jgi:hypothetical protein
VVRSTVRSVGCGIGVARAQQGLRADRANVFAAVAAVDAVPTYHVRLPLLREYTAHLRSQRHRAAARLVVGCSAPTLTAMDERSSHRSIRRRRRFQFRVLLPDLGRSRPELESVAPAHVDRQVDHRPRLAEPTDSIALKC